MKTKIKIEITPAISSMIGEAAAKMGISFDVFCTYALFRTAEAVLIEASKKDNTQSEAMNAEGTEA